MILKYDYSVFPADISTIYLLEGEKIISGKSMFIISIGVVGALWGAIGYFVNLYSSGNGWWLFGWYIALISFIFSWIEDKDNIKKSKINKVNNQARYFSSQLNNILNKSEEIVRDILPYLETSAQKSIDAAKVDFSENALSPFWDKIEEASKFLACYKQAVEQLVLNGELYSKLLEGRQHNFPKPFPIGANIPILQSVLTDYHYIIRKAQSNFEFANIWEHRKTQKILIAGFQTLEQAINNMKESVFEAIYNLGQSIKSEFRELNNIKIEQIRNFKDSQDTINRTLTSMDNKLYYIQYNKKPTTPFF